MVRKLRDDDCKGAWLKAQPTVNFTAALPRYELVFRNGLPLWGYDTKGKGVAWPR